MNEYLIETDFLFGLRPSDPHNEKVEKALQLVKEKKLNLKLINSALFEVRTVLYSQGKKSEEISNILLLMKTKLEEYNIIEVSIQFDDFILAESLRIKHKELTYFDSLHAAVSKRRNISIYGTDKVLKKLNFILKTFDDDL